MVMVVVVMVMACGKSRRAGEDHQEQDNSENFLHGRHPSRIDLATKEPWRDLNQERNEGM